MLKVDVTIIGIGCRQAPDETHQVLVMIAEVIMLPRTEWAKVVGNRFLASELDLKRFDECFAIIVTLSLMVASF